MKGIVLAGGTGSRLFPITMAVSKQLLPVYNKPMIYYPLSTLILAGIREILMITTPTDRSSFERLLGDGSQWGLKISYAVQEKPRGLADAFVVGREFIGSSSVCLILGDNIFYCEDLSDILAKASKLEKGAQIFGYYVQDPTQYGVVEFDDLGNVIGLEEKPKNPKSSYAVPGLYFYDNEVVKIASELKPSPRGEIEITDLNMIYLKAKKMKVNFFSRGTAWLDTGTYESFQQASNFVHAIETRQGLLIGCPEEVAYRKGFIDKAKLLAAAGRHQHTDYGKYLARLAEEKDVLRGLGGHSAR